MKYSVNVYGLGNTIKTTIESDRALSCEEALDKVVSGAESELVMMNVTFMVNAKRALAGDMLSDGDSLIVMSILGGG